MNKKELGICLIVVFTLALIIPLGNITKAKGTIDQLVERSMEEAEIIAEKVVRDYYKNPNNVPVTILELDEVTGHDGITLQANALPYRFTYEFQRSVESSKLNVNQSSLSFTLTSSNATADGTFQLSLYRDKLFGDEFIGRASFPQNGAGQATFNNLDSGTYYFILTKSNSGTVSGSGRAE